MPRRASVAIEVTAETTGPTGVEMEALTAASVGLLTIYDMCKSADRGMRIDAIRLLEKSGGQVRPFRRRTVDRWGQVEFWAISSADTDCGGSSELSSP